MGVKVVLEKMGCEVYFVPYQRASDTILHLCWQVIKCCIKLRFSMAYYLIKRKLQFLKAQRFFNIIKSKKEIDLFIFGSDTIWNFENPFFQNQKLFFIGKGITQPRYTYAVSGGSTSIEFFENDSLIKDEIGNFYKISVRDDYIKCILEKLFPEKQISRVLDPTLLLKSSDYYSFINQPPLSEDYIFIYYFGNISEQLFNTLSHFACKKRLKLVKMGNPDKRFEYNITNNPNDFIRYFYYAKYVITNTFHGCVFSVLFNKQFITDGFNKKKIEDFMNRFGLQTQYLMDISTFEKQLTEPINYERINAEIEKERNISLNYLKEIIIKGYQK